MQLKPNMSGQSHVAGAAPPEVWGRRLGARFDPNGPHAHKARFAAFRLAPRQSRPVTLPPQMDLRQGFPPVVNQAYNSCVAESLTAAYAYAAFKTSAYKASQTGNSRLFLYYQARAVDGLENRDEGAFIGSGAQSLVTVGISEESYHPYSLGPFIKPDKNAHADALDHKALSVRMVDQNLAAIKELLASGYPIVIGFLVFPSLQTAQVERTGDIPLPSAAERNRQPLGGHAVVLVGYDDATQRFFLRNSWGTSWGVNGYGSLPYQYILDNYLSQDFWVILDVNDDVIRDAPPGPAPQPPTPQPDPWPVVPPTPGPCPVPCPCPWHPPQPPPQPSTECCSTCDPARCCCARTRMPAGSVIRRSRAPATRTSSPVSLTRYATAPGVPHSAWQMDATPWHTTTRLCTSQSPVTCWRP